MQTEIQTQDFLLRGNCVNTELVCVEKNVCDMTEDVCLAVVPWLGDCELKAAVVCMFMLTADHMDHLYI